LVASPGQIMLPTCDFSWLQPQSSAATIPKKMMAEAFMRWIERRGGVVGNGKIAGLDGPVRRSEGNQDNGTSFLLASKTVESFGFFISASLLAQASSKSCKLGPSAKIKYLVS